VIAGLRSSVRARIRGDQAGFSLVEILIAIVLMGAIAGVVVTALSTSLNASATTTQKVKESNDAQLAAAFLVRDAQAAGGTDPLTAQTDSSVGVSTSDATSCGAAGSLVIRFSWTDRQTVSTSRSMVATWGFDATTHTLTRRTCTAGAAGVDVVVGRNVASVGVTCTGGTGGGCSGLPATVSVTITETNTPSNGPTPFTYTLQASVRPQGQSLPTSSTATSVPLLALGGGTCSSGVGASGIYATGHSLTVVNGDVLVNAQGSTGCPAMAANGSADFDVVNGTTQIFGTGTCTGNNCPPYSNYSPSLNDPFATLTAPSATCTGSNPSPVNGHFTPSGTGGPLVFPQLLTTGDVTFDSGVYVFCNGIATTGGADIQGSNVLWYVKGGTLNFAGNTELHLTAASSGTYANVVIWIDKTNPQSITFDGNGTVNTIGGLIYAPTSVITLTGTSGNSVGGIVAKQIISTGSGDNRLGPTITLTIAPATLPNGAVGTAYTSTSLSASGGVPAYAWSLSAGSNPLPPGLTLSSGGVLSGTPTGSGGTYSFTVKATDSVANTGSRTYTVTIGGPSVTITAPTTLPTAYVGQSYTQAVTGANGTTPYTWGATGLQPIGLDIGLFNGVITGTPTTAGTFTVTVTVYDANLVSYTKSYSLTVATTPVITGPASLPSRTVGKAYPSTSISATGGTTPYTWSATGLPSNMSINSSTGAISGTPNSAGTFTVTVTVTDVNGAIGSKQYALVINGAPSITTSSLPNWTVNRTYPSTTVSGTGGTSPYSWSASNLPNGLTMSSSGVITGMPTSTGTKSVTVTLTDASGATAQRTYSVSINAAPTITAPTTLAPWTVGQAYPSVMASGSGGTAPYTWSATGLPPGITIDDVTGIISGTPTTTGSYGVIITLTDNAGAADTQSIASFTINGAPTITGPASLPGGTTGTAYSVTVTASGGTTPRMFSATGLPAGLTIGASTGTISGTPSTAGTYSVVVTVTDNAGATATRNYTVTVIAPLTIASPASLPDRTRGVAYSTSFAATGGTSPYTWSWSSATGLPPGMTLSSTTGTLSGTPTTAGTYTFTVTVTDAAARTAQRTYTWKVNPPLVLATTITVPANSSGQTPVLVSGGTASYTITAGAVPYGTFNTANGTITGKTPKSPPSQQFTVTITDSGGGSVSGTVTLNLT
jgi:prepilin-type N-terminal cleavage/methylation domain-containing protein